MPCREPRDAAFRLGVCANACDCVWTTTCTPTQDYRGTAPFSEPEVAAIRDFTANHDFRVALNFHSYGRFINIPFATDAQGLPQEPHLSIFNSLAEDMSKVNHYLSGQAWSEVRNHGARLSVLHNGAAADRSLCCSPGVAVHCQR